MKKDDWGVFKVAKAKKTSYTWVMGFPGRAYSPSSLVFVHINRRGIVTIRWE